MNYGGVGSWSGSSGAVDDGAGAGAAASSAGGSTGAGCGSSSGSSGGAGAIASDGGSVCGAGAGVAGFDRALAATQADPNGQDRRQALAMIAWARGDKERAQAQLDELIRLDGANAPGLIAEVHAFEGNLDEAFVWLDRAMLAKDPSAASIYETPPEVIATLRKDPRFAAFCRKLGLPAPAGIAVKGSTPTSGAIETSAVQPASERAR